MQSVKMLYEKLEKHIDSTLNILAKDIVDKPMVTWLYSGDLKSVQDFVEFLKKIGTPSVKSDYVKLMKELKTCKSITKINDILYTMECDNMTFTYFLNYYGYMNIFSRDYVEVAVELTSNILKQSMIIYLGSKFLSDETVEVAKETVKNLYDFVELDIVNRGDEDKVARILMSRNVPVIPFHISNKYVYLYTPTSAYPNIRDRYIFFVAGVSDDKIFVIPVTDDDLTNIIKDDLNEINKNISPDILQELIKVFDKVVKNVQ